MKLEIRCYVIVGSACVAILISAHFQHPECIPGKEWCEMHWVHLKDGHDREPVPANTRQAMTATITTSASLALDTGADFPAVWWR